MSQPKGQSRYGVVSHDSLESDTKMGIMLAAMGGIQDIVKDRMIKDGIYDKFIEAISKNKAVSHVVVQTPLPTYEYVDTQDLDFTSCRVRDLPADFAWGTATASF